jgi:competence transcription factor ComK
MLITLELNFISFKNFIVEIEAQSLYTKVKFYSVLSRTIGISYFSLKNRTNQNIFYFI